MDCKKRKLFNVRLNYNEQERLDGLSDYFGISRSAVLRILIKQYYERLLRHGN